MECVYNVNVMALFPKRAKEFAQEAGLTRSVMPDGLLPPPRSQIVVNPDRAASLTAVYRAIQIIATAGSQLPLRTFRYDTLIDNPLIVNSPNVDQTRRDFYFSTLVSLATFGEAFWYFDNLNLWVLHPDLVTVKQDEKTGRIKYTYNETDYDRDVIKHIRFYAAPGMLRGLGPIQACREDIQASLDLRAYASEWFGQAGIPTGVLSSGAPINSQQADELRGRWNEIQATRQVAVLGNGFNYSPIALNPKDALFIENQAFSVQQVARLFGIPARYLLSAVDGGSQTYSNLEQENQAFLQYTLVNYLKPIEDALSSVLPRGQRAEFKIDALLRTDLAARFSAYKTALDAGFMSIDEVRQAEGLAGQIPAPQPVEAKPDGSPV